MKNKYFSVWFDGEQYCHCSDHEEPFNFIMNEIKNFLLNAKDRQDVFIKCYVDEVDNLKDETKSYPKCRYVNQDECPYYPTDCYNCLHPDEVEEDECS